MDIIETHCHLDYLKNEPLDSILQKSKNNGVKKIITISVDPDNIDTVYNLSKQYEEVYFTQGIHPHDAIKSNDDVLKVIRSRCHEKKMVAVGEIGLDYYYNHSPKDVQLKVFEEQIQIAIEENKPIVVHSRDADEDMIMMLKKFAPKLNKKGVIHSFTSSKELAQVALEMGFYIGFNGIITFKNAQNVRDIVDLVPLERIVAETDAPFLTPVPHRGKENAPFYLPHIIEHLALLKQESVENISKIILKNSETLFFSA